jgi:hypothetical protein
MEPHGHIPQFKWDSRKVPILASERHFQPDDCEKIHWQTGACGQYGNVLSNATIGLATA